MCIRDRIGYVAVGILLAWIANCVVLPYRRKNASAQLWKKYGEACGLLVRVCRQENADKQLYYSLVIQVHLMEEKLCPVSYTHLDVYKRQRFRPARCGKNLHSGRNPE